MYWSRIRPSRYSAAVSICPDARREHSAIPPEARLLHPAAPRGERPEIGRITGFNLVDTHQMRRRLEDRLPQCGERIVGQLLAQYVRQRANDRPVLTRLSRRK